MKILQINNVYGEKSTGKLTQAVHQGLLARGYESVVIYGRGRSVKESGVIRLCPEWYGKGNALLARVSGIPYGGCTLSTLRLQRILLQEQPDVVHLQCVNGNFVNLYRLLRWLKTRGIPTVVSLHGEFLYTGNCGHAFACDQWHHGCGHCPDKRSAVKSWFFDRTGESWRRMRRAFRGFGENCVICPVSPWTLERAKQSDILKDLAFSTVYNGVDRRVFHPSGAEKEDVVLHVTAHFSPEKDHLKGGWHLLELAKRMPEVTFLVAGPADPVSVLPENVKLLGVVSDQSKLAALYRRARLTLLVSRRETYSMPCAESLCCGTPVVGFAAGGPESIALEEYTEFVPYGDLDGLERAVKAWLYKDTDARAVAGAAEIYSVERMLHTLETIYGSLQ